MINVDIVTGFLGSGKTTFIRTLMKSKAWADEKWAVVVNEFGKVGIDGSFLESVSDVSVVEISNGCLCCTLKGDFIEALRKLAVEYKPDRIIIEPSGIFVLADLSDLFEQPVLSDVCRLHSVIAIVDPWQFTSQRMKYNYFLESQIRHSSILVLSKTGNYVESLVTQTLEGLKALNEGAALLAEPWENFDFSWFRILLDAAVYKPPAYLAGSDKNPALLHGDEIDIQSFGLPDVRDMTSMQFQEMLDGMRRGLYGEVLRMKGYLRVDGVMRELNYSLGGVPEKIENDSSDDVIPATTTAELTAAHAELAAVYAGPAAHAELPSVPSELISASVPADLSVVRSKISVIGSRLHYGMLTRAFWRLPESETVLGQ
jgi:G3E family GTPase